MPLRVISTQRARRLFIIFTNHSLAVSPVSLTASYWLLVDPWEYHRVLPSQCLAEEVLWTLISLRSSYLPVYVHLLRWISDLEINVCVFCSWSITSHFFKFLARLVVKKNLRDPSRRLLWTEMSMASMCADRYVPFFISHMEIPFCWLGVHVSS